MMNEKSKILIVVFILLILISGIIVVRKIKKPVSTPPETQQESTQADVSPGQANDAESNIIDIRADVSSVATGESFETAVSFKAPGRKIFGSDLVILYDPSYLSTDQSRVTPGIFFAITPRINVDSENGIIKISAYQGNGEQIGEKTEIVKINFTALRPGNSQIGLSFTKGMTNTTTLVEAETSQNILEKTESFTIKVN